MSISVDCDKCGGTFPVQEKRAGKKVYCKLCNGVVRVPQPTVGNTDEEDESLFESLSDITPLPRTKSVLPRRPRRTRRASSVTWSWPLSKRATAGAVVMVPIGIVLLVAQFYPIVGTIALSGVFLLFIVGIWLAMLAGVVLMFIGGIGTMIAAFEEDAACGLRYFFVPFYSLYYMISRWDETRYPKLAAYGFLLLMGPSFLIVGLNQLLNNNGTGANVVPNRGAHEFVRNPPNQPPGKAPGAIRDRPVPNNPAERQQLEAQEAFEKLLAETSPHRDRNSPLREDEALRISAPIENVALNAGDKVLTKWGSNWWHGKIVAIQPDGRIKVHYDGWSDQSDEVVTTDRIRIPNP